MKYKIIKVIYFACHSNPYMSKHTNILSIKFTLNNFNGTLINETLIFALLHGLWRTFRSVFIKRATFCFANQLQDLALLQEEDLGLQLQQCCCSKLEGCSQNKRWDVVFFKFPSARFQNKEISEWCALYYMEYAYWTVSNVVKARVTMVESISLLPLILR